eukprot:m.205076 g.205076  ORF g.205076 m.205076 type:complete len:426 (-) comp32905_c0_seq1:1750-3027(-)
MQFSGGGCETNNQQQQTSQKNKKLCLQAPGSATASPILHRKGFYTARQTVCAFTVTIDDQNINTYDAINNNTPLTAFQASKEDFDSYLERCFGHQLVDLSAKHPGNTSYSSGYVRTFRRKWQDHDPKFSGFVKCSDLIILMDDLAIANYHHDVNNDDIFLNFFGGKDQPVSLRQFSNFAERFDVQGTSTHVGEAQPAVHESNYTLAHCLGHLAIDLGVADALITKHCVFQSTDVIHDLETPTHSRAMQQLDVATRDRIRWYIEAWRKRCGVRGECVASSAPLSASTKLPKLHYSQVLDLLKEAVMDHGFSRFAQSSSRGYIKHSVAEAAAMLKVQSHATHIDFMDFCTVVESPEPCVYIPNFALSARITTLLPWRSRFHSLFKPSERLTVHTMLLILQRLKSNYNSLALQDVWISHTLGCGQWLE